MSTAITIATRLSGFGARQRLIASAATAAMQPRMKPNLPATCCLALITSGEGGFGGDFRLGWEGTLAR